MGPAPFARWHCWQLRCRMGTMSFAKVTSPGAADCARRATGAKEPTRTATSNPDPSADARYPIERPTMTFIAHLRGDLPLSPQLAYSIYLAQPGRHGVALRPLGLCRLVDRDGA